MTESALKIWCVSELPTNLPTVQNADNQALPQTNKFLLQRVFIRIVFNELSEDSVVYQVNETTVRILHRGFDIRLS